MSWLLLPRTCCQLLYEAYVERVFSVCLELRAGKRNRLTYKSLEKRIMLKMNLKYYSNNGPVQLRQIKRTNLILSRAPSDVDKARLLAAASPHSGDWLHAPPITAVGLRLWLAVRRGRQGSSGPQVGL